MKPEPERKPWRKTRHKIETWSIYHNPRCSKSRVALQMLEDAGIAVQVVDNQKSPLDRAQLLDLLAKLKLPAAAVVRCKEPVYTQLGLDKADEAALVDALLAHPQLLERPIVVRGEVAMVCRPPTKLEAWLVE